jgi:2-polyprenyl-3-methyl-5-hydroxy-6-metoxy-1,4-benzoquinol methylase
MELRCEIPICLQEAVLKEALLEPLLRRMRIGQVLPTLLQHPDCSLLDIGCGWEARLLKSVEPYVKRGVGVDFKAPSIATSKLTTITATLADRLPFSDAEFDVVTLLAVLEHLSHPRAMIEEIGRVLKPRGQVILTVPSLAAKPVLEFLAYRVGIVSETEIRDHKCYYDRKSLEVLFAGSGLTIDRHRYFQLGMNNFLVATRVDAPPSGTSRP